MKNILTILLFSILTFSCSKNDFENTNLYLQFDKETYQTNDTFNLTVRIVPIETKRNIRFYKNLNNIKISFSSTEKQYGFEAILKEKFIEGPSLTGDDSEYIDDFTISKEKPFERIFPGTITELENEIIFEIPDLKLSDKIDKSILAENPTVLINGKCVTVYGIEYKPFEQTEIKVQ